MNSWRSLCVYCGSKEGIDPLYRQTAHNTGKDLAKKNIRLVYGGGDVGLMKIVADACLEFGGQVVGVIPERLRKLELAHPRLSELHITQGMHARKALMSELADAFLALPGGFGTLEELFEMLTWAQLGYHSKPIGLLNTAGYYDSLLQCIDQMVTQGFLSPHHQQLLHVDSDVEQLLTDMASTD